MTRPGANGLAATGAGARHRGTFVQVLWAGCPGRTEPDERPGRLYY
jgi:hypothetical protein